MGSTPNPAAKLQHVRPVRPLDLPVTEPESERMPESRRHLFLRTLVVAFLRQVCLPQHSFGGDQFVYWNAARPRSLAPDAFVKLNAPDTGHFGTWRTWERGVPEVVVEILSPSDSPERRPFDKKLEGYHAMGVHEVVCFDVDAAPGARLRVWDLIDGDMVERVVTEECTSCVALSASGSGRHFEWLVARADAEPAALRLRCDLALVPTPDEHAAYLARERDAAAGERDAIAAERDAIAAERDDALARIAELEKRLGE